MPAVPYREDDDARDAPSRGRPRPAAVWSYDDDDPAPGPYRRAPRRPERAPALEGLTASGAAVVGLFGTTLGAIVDVVVSPGLGWIFFVAFLVMSAFVGLRLRGRDSWAAVAVPPLVYISAAGIAAQAAPVTEGSWVERTSGDMATAVLDHPYVLVIGTALAIVAFVYRSLLD
jgi:hypothetical protein